MPAFGELKLNFIALLNSFKETFLFLILNEAKMQYYRFLSSLKQFQIFTFIALLFFIQACETTEVESKPETLYVKFENNPNSVVTITSILIQHMGKAGESTTPSGDWSSNIIKDDEKIEPGQHLFFTLEIPNLHWVRYRLGVDDGTGQEIFLHEQPNYQESDLPITHWGGDDRTVTVEIRKNETSGMYYVGSWMESVGIE